MKCCHHPIYPRALIFVLAPTDNDTLVPTSERSMQNDESRSRHNHVNTIVQTDLEQVSSNGNGGSADSTSNNIKIETSKSRSPETVPVWHIDTTRPRTSKAWLLIASSMTLVVAFGQHPNVRGEDLKDQPLRNMKMASPCTLPAANQLL